MIRYICNRCKKDIVNKKDVTTIQTKRIDESAVYHLCPSCVNVIRGIYEKAVETFESTTKSEQSGSTIRQYEFKPESTITPNFNINVESFNKEMEKVPRASTVPGFQRILLALYKGLPSSQVADMVGKSYQEVYRIKSRYGCQKIARRHLESGRQSEDVVKIIDSFITCGDIDEVQTRTGYDKSKISETLKYYTGLTFDYDAKEEPGETNQNFPIKIDSMPDTLLKYPRATALLTVMRAVLCIYKGMGLTDTSNILHKSTQDVYRYRSCYTSKEIAKRHLEPERMDLEVNSIIETFVENGDIYQTAGALGLQEYRVREVLEYYTGLLREGA